MAYSEIKFDSLKVSIDNGVRDTINRSHIYTGTLAGQHSWFTTRSSTLADYGGFKYINGNPMDNIPTQTAGTYPTLSQIHSYKYTGTTAIDDAVVSFDRYFEPDNMTAVAFSLTGRIPFTSTGLTYSQSNQTLSSLRNISYTLNTRITTDGYGTTSYRNIYNTYIFLQDERWYVPGDSSEIGATYSLTWDSGNDNNATLKYGVITKRTGLDAYDNIEGEAAYLVDSVVSYGSNYDSNKISTSNSVTNASAIGGSYSIYKRFYDIELNDGNIEATKYMVRLPRVYRLEDDVNASPRALIEDDVFSTTAVSTVDFDTAHINLTMSSTNNWFESYVFYKYPIRFSKLQHSTPTLYISSKILTWDADSTMLNSGWVLEHDTDSSFTSPTSISLSQSTTSYTIPNDLYYTTSGTKRYWRLRKQRNEDAIFEENNSITTYRQTSGTSTYLDLARTTQYLVSVLAYNYSNWSSSLNTDVRLAAPTNLLWKTTQLDGGALSLNTRRITWTHSTDATSYEWAYSSTGPWTSIAKELDVGEITLSFSTPGSKTFYIRSVISDAYGSYNSASSTLSVLDDPTIVKEGRSTVNSYAIKWNRPSNANTSNDIDDISYQWKHTVGTTVIQDWTTTGINTTSLANPTLIVPNLRYATNIIEIRTLYVDDSDYDATDTSINIITTDVPKLSKPTLTKTNLTDTETIDGTSTTVITGIQLSWNTVSLAAGYKLKIVRDTAGTVDTYYLPSSGLSTGTSQSFDLDNQNGFYTYSVEARTNITYDDVEYTDFYSDYSTTVTDTVTDIDAIDDLAWGTTTPENLVNLTWTKPTGSDYTEYNFLSSTSAPSVENFTTGTTINARDVLGATSLASVYTVLTYALSYDKYHKRPSAASNMLTYTTIKVGTPGRPVWNGTDTLTWTAGTNATDYDVYEVINGVNTLLDTVQTTSYTNSFDSGLHTVFIVARNVTIVNGYNINEYSNPRYITSSPSTSRTFGTLYTPVLTRTSDLLEWTPPVPEDENIYWELYKSSELLTNVYVQQYSLGFLQVPGSYAYKVRAAAATPDGSYTGPFSNEITYTIVKLDTPVIAFNANTSEVYWTAISDATHYDIYVNGTVSETITTAPTTGDPWVINESVQSGYNIKVVARNETDPFLYRQSDQSNTLVYNVYTLETPVIEYDSALNKISWTSYADSDTNNFIIMLDDEFSEYDENYDSTIANYYTFSLAAGTYSTKIYAQKTGQITNPNPKYLDSGESNEIFFGTLGTPVISMDDNTVIWDAIPFAEYYEVYNGDELYTIVETPNIELVAYAPRTFSITVWAKNDDPNMYDELSISNRVTYSFYQLSTPKLSLINTTELSWGYINNADEYDIYMNGSYLTTTSANSYDFENMFLVGSNSFSIVATSNLKNMIESNFSSSVYFTKNAKYKYMAEVDGVEYEVWIPFTIQKTLDGSLNTGEIILAPIDTKLPFEKDTPVSFYVYDDGNLLPIVAHHMLVDTDRVDEIQIGFNSKFKHTIKLIGKTRLLQYEIFSMAISQTREYIETRYSNEVFNTQSPDKDGNHILRTWSRYLPLGDATAAGVSYITVDNDFILPELPVQASMLTGITIPDLAENLLYKITRWGYFSFLPSLIGPQQKIYNVRPDVRWYYRKYGVNGYTTYQYDKSDSYTETRITDISKPWVPSTAGTYDLIIEIPAAYAYTDAADNEYYLNFMTDDTPNQTSGAWTTSQQIPFRVVYPGIEINSTVGDTFTINAEGFTVADALKKALDSVQPIGYTDSTANKGSKATGPKYKIDSTSLAIADAVPCPDLSYENKSLYEILLDMGSLFQGIPKMENKDNNLITFKIIDQMETNELFEDSTELMVLNSPKASYSTGFISDAKNLITESQIMTFPMGDTWTTARSSNDGFVKLDNYSILLPFPIKRVIDLRVKGIKANPEIEVSLIRYLKEKTIYDSLDDTNNTEILSSNSKARALYYKEGDNVIGGFGTLPNASEQNATWGFSETMYVIQHILETIGVDPSSSNVDVKDLQYKVWYEPMLDTKLKFERGNIAETANSSYKSLNQDAHLLSDKMIAQSTARQLSRLSNRFISKNYRLQNFEAVPELGQVKYLDTRPFYADIIRYSYFNNYIDVAVNYSERINKLNERMKPDSSYRMYNIESKGYVNRDIHFDEYCYITKSDYSDYEYPDDMKPGTRDMSIIIGNIFNSITSTTLDYVPNALYIKNLDLDNNILQYTNFDDEATNLPKLALPVTYNALGNSFALSAEMLSNYSAGKRLADSTDDYVSRETIKNVDGSTGEITYTINLTPYQRQLQRDVRYVDNDGRASIMDISFLEADGSTFSYNPQISLPEATRSKSSTYLDSTAILRQSIWINKDMREKLRFQYQMHFQTYDKDVYIHPDISESLFRHSLPETIPYYGHSQNKWYLFQGDVKNNNIKATKELSVPNAATTEIISGENAFVVGEDTFTGYVNGNYDGYMLMNPDTKKIIFAYKTSIPRGSYGSTNRITVPWTFRFSPAKLPLQES